MTEDELALCLTTLLGKHPGREGSEPDTSGTALTFHAAQKQDHFDSQIEQFKLQTHYPVRPRAVRNTQMGLQKWAWSYRLSFSQTAIAWVYLKINGQ